MEPLHLLLFHRAVFSTAAGSQMRPPITAKKGLIRIDFPDFRMSTFSQFSHDFQRFLTNSRVPRGPWVTLGGPGEPWGSKGELLRGLMAHKTHGWTVASISSRIFKLLTFKDRIQRRFHGASSVQIRTQHVPNSPRGPLGSSWELLGTLFSVGLNKTPKVSTIFELMEIYILDHSEALLWSHRAPQGSPGPRGALQSSKPCEIKGNLKMLKFENLENLSLISVGLVS